MHRIPDPGDHSGIEVRKNNWGWLFLSHVVVRVGRLNICQAFCRFVVVIGGDNTPFSDGFCDHIVYLSYLTDGSFKNESGDKIVD